MRSANPHPARTKARSKLAGIRPVADGPASPERHGARFCGVRMGSAARPETGKRRQA
jgi:hypothetical protein